MSSCPCAEKCWRLSYSKYYKETGNEDCPSRSELFFLGFATEEMSQTVETSKGKTIYKGVYAQNFPSPSGENFCPEMSGEMYENCEEYNKNKRRQDKLKRAQERGQRNFKERYGYNRAPISKNVRVEIALKSKYKCVYCLRHVTRFKNTGAKGVIDHFIPLKKHGKDEYDNYVYACSNCNNSKQDQLWDRGCRVGYYDMEAVNDKP